MMRILSLLIFHALISTIAYSQLENVRQLYFSASDNAGIETFFQSTRKLNESDAIQLAYKGVASAMYAEVASKVKDKLDWFNLGKEQLERALVMSSGNAEIVFLRFSMQCEVPGFLGYNTDISDDANFIIGSLRAKKIDPAADYWKKAISFMQNSGELNKLHEAALSKYRTEIN